ncbi:MAG: histidinol-phosphate transaminase [bacterium]
MSDSELPENFIRPELEEINAYQPGKPRREIQREYNLDELPVKLASNENPFSPPDFLKQVYREEFEKLNRYPDGGCYYLKRALAENYDWPAEGIILGAGSDEVLDCLAKSTLRPGDEIITADPAFVMYKIDANMMGATPVEVPLDEKFDIDLEGFLDRITDSTRWICLPNPNNPTSRYLTASQLQNFIAEVPADCLVVMDEAYAELMVQSDYPDGVELLRNRRDDAPEIVVLRTLSKAYGLAGLRVGYGLMNPRLATQLNKVRPPFNVTRPSQVVARRALEGNDYLEKVRRVLARERKKLVKELEERGYPVVPPAANFMLVRAAKENTAGEICEKLLAEGVIVRSMAPYGLEDYFRLSVGQPEENELFLRKLDKISE